MLGLGMIFSTALLVSVLCLLAAILPSGTEARLKQRMWLRLPFAFMAAVLIMVGMAFLPEWWEGRHGMHSLSVKHEEIELAPEADCAGVHEGIFVGPAVRIERRGDHQYQKDLVLGIEQELRVRWSDPCTYVLLDADSMEMGHVRITAVDAAGYDCLVTMGPGSMYAYALRLDRPGGER